MGDTFFHCDCHQVTLLLLSDHLVKFLNVNRVIFLFKDGYLSGRADIHGLLDAHSDPLVLSGVDAMNSERISLCVVAHMLNL
jgi:hypothetical protein